jgi:hypothetical protein
MYYHGVPISVAGWGTMLQIRRLLVLFTMRLLDFVPSSRTVALMLTQYQESYWDVKNGRSIRLTTSPPSVRQ